MTERKFTGEEVIKALECCTNGECDECPYQDDSPCREYLNNAALDLINRQRAEIEAWETGQKALQKNLSQIIRAEAIKEFAERLKSYLLLNKDGQMSVVSFEDINRLAKEMTEGNDG